MCNLLVYECGTHAQAAVLITMIYMYVPAHHRKRAYAITDYRAQRYSLFNPHLHTMPNQKRILYSFCR